MKARIASYLVLLFCFSFSSSVKCQIIGAGEIKGVTTTSSPSASLTESRNTLSGNGFIANLNGISKFLSQSSFGADYNDLQQVTTITFDQWIDNQFNAPREFILEAFVDSLQQIQVDSLGVLPDEVNARSRYFDFAWWQYTMSSDDVLKQRVALALSEIFVISSVSAFENNPYALASYYDMLLENALGNYRQILEKVTFHPAMGVYLTFMNNPKSNLILNTFPDENYAREVMQLFSIGLYELYPNGERKLDGEGNLIPTYSNFEIAEFSKIFTGFSWGDGDEFGDRNKDYKSYTQDMVMYDEYHEPGEKFLLNNVTVIDRDPVNGLADVQDALDNLYNHPNVGPFIGKLLIQRLVTSNPSKEYVERVTNVFNNNGQGERGDLKAVVKAILLDDEARACSNSEEALYGKLKEPFLRYVQLCKALNLQTTSGQFRNSMSNVYALTGQKPLASPSVFNFFQADYQPLGPIEEADMVAPEFQITNTQTIPEYFNALDRWVMDNKPTDYSTIFSGETTKTNEIGFFDFSYEESIAGDDMLHILIDRFNLLLCHGNLSEMSRSIITHAVKQFDDDDRDDRVRAAIVLIMSSPEYLINH